MKTTPRWERIIIIYNSNFHFIHCRVFLTTTTEPDIFILVLLKIFTSGSILGGAGAVRHFQIPNSTRSPSRIRPRFDHHQIPKTQVLFFLSQFSSQNFPIFDPKLSFPSWSCNFPFDFSFSVSLKRRRFPFGVLDFLFRVLIKAWIFGVIGLLIWCNFLWVFVKIEFRNLGFFSIIEVKLISFWVFFLAIGGIFVVLFSFLDIELGNCWNRMVFHNLMRI